MKVKLLTGDIFDMPNSYQIDRFREFMQDQKQDHIWIEFNFGKMAIYKTALAYVIYDH